MRRHRAGAEALLVEEEAVPQNGSGIVRANGLVRS
jgi:hypothetical protein